MASGLTCQERHGVTNIPGLGFWEWDVGQDRLIWSDELVAMYGFQRPPGSERRFIEAIHPEDRVRVEADLTTSLICGDSFAHEFRIVRPNGEVRLIHDRGVIERDPSGAAIRMYGVHVDVTDQRVAAPRRERSAVQEALALSETRLASALRAGRLGVHEYYPQLNLLVWDARVREIWGVDPDEPITYAVFEAGLHPDDRERTNRAVAAALDPHGPGHYECTYRVRNRKTGEWRWVHADGDVSFDAGAAVRLLGTAGDVTDRIESERELAAVKHRFELALHNSPVSVFEQDRELRYTWIYNPMLGLAASDVLGKTDGDLADARDAELISALKRHVLSTGTSIRRDVRMRRAAGEGGVFDLYIEPRRDEAGDVIGISCVATEITHLRETESALLERAREIEAIHDSAPVGIVLFDRDLNFVRVNERLARANGRSMADHIGRSAGDILPDDTMAQLRAICARLLAGEDMVEAEVSGPDSTGANSDWRVAYRALRNEAGEVTHFLGVINEVTQQKRAEEHIRLLMHEVNHRSKNILSVVQAIARQTLRTSPDDFAQRFSERLKALSASNELLVREEWRGAELSELARSQLAYCADAVGRRIVLTGPHLQLSPSAAQTLGMALHELATNALKYGALSNRDGVVHLEWQVAREDAGPRFIISWTESGGPEVVKPLRRGFGTTVVEMTAAALSGKVELRFEPEGCRWRLECALSHVAARG